ncbi:hypothetical protein GUITHDRAFT_66699, partial [Guillardia theta CCMP2712]
MKRRERGGALVIEEKPPPPRLIIMGGPGCGKGTICRALVQQFGVVHISVGDVLREEIAKGSEIGKQIEEHLKEGRLVSDELALSIVRDKVSQPEVQQHGWLLDNFPRTTEQAEAMVELGIIPEKFIYIEVPDNILLERCLGRMVDPVTGDIYHSHFRPPPDDPEVKARLIRRLDDNSEAVERRLEAFQENMDSVLEIF